MLVCNRCGKCCLEGSRNTWVGGRLTWEEKQNLLAIIKTKPPNETGCLMLYFKNDLAYCLVREVYGIEKIDPLCANYECDIKEENKMKIELDITEEGQSVIDEMGVDLQKVLDNQVNSYIRMAKQKLVKNLSIEQLDTAVKGIKE